VTVPGYEGNGRDYLLGVVADTAREFGCLVDWCDLQALTYGKAGDVVDVPFWRDGEQLAAYRFTIPRVIETLRSERGEALIASHFGPRILTTGRNACA
jgi:hypothetical protein